LSEATYLLDVNVLLALLSENHSHHLVVTTWFNAEQRTWAICAFSEAGFLRNATAERPGQVSMSAATTLLSELMARPNARYIPLVLDWQSLCSPLFPRLYGTKQVTDAYLLGLAIHERLVLVTMDRGIIHLAGSQYRSSVLLLPSERNSPPN
jgi:toxin-antitoxin system PIN domain toxin